MNPLRLRDALYQREVIARRKTGMRVWPATFSDRLTGKMPQLRNVWRLLRSGEARASRADADRIPVRRLGLDLVPADTLAITWVGHASFVIRMDGRTILTDPVWGDIRALRRITPPGVAWEDLPRIDAVVISHNHYDHLDVATIKRLPRHTPVLVPAALGTWFTKRGFTDVTELDWWESVSIASITFDFVPAHHWSRRTLWDNCTTLWGGWVMTSEHNHRAYFAGDSGYGPYFSQIGERYPGIDIAMLPIGAYSPRWFHRTFHMDPTEAVRACTDVGAGRMVPMHWGTFILTAEPLLEPSTRLREEWTMLDRDQHDLWDLAIGQTHVL